MCYHTFRIRYDNVDLNYLFLYFVATGLGIGMIMVSGIVCIYYNLIITWVLYYLFKSFTKVLPWSECGHWWNTPLCLVRSASNENMTAAMINASMVDPELLSGGVNTTAEVPSYYATLQRIVEAKEYANVTGNASIPWKSPAEEFWQYVVLFP